MSLSASMPGGQSMIVTEENGSPADVEEDAIASTRPDSLEAMSSALQPVLTYQSLVEGNTDTCTERDSICVVSGPGNAR